jgi:uncharacterized SAM-binding protein YcdF (DUF218 family)
VRVLRSIILLLFALAVACIAGFAMLCLRIDFCGRIDLAQPADAIVVLGAQVMPNGLPGPDLTSRTQHAVALYQSRLAPRLICAGGVAGDQASAASVCRALALASYVPAEVIHVADGSTNTAEDAHQVALLMAENGWQTVIVASHPLHVYRAKLFFEREGITAYTSPTNTNLGDIDLHLRAYYTMRECLGILWPYLEQVGLPPHWTASLQELVYSSGP